MRCCFLLVVLCVLAAPALAQPAMAPATTPFIIDRNRVDRTVPAPSPPPSVAPPAPDDALALVKPFILNAVQIRGTSLAPAALGAATQSLVGRLADGTAIREIAARVSGAYADSGDVALYTVTVPQQDFAGGVLILIVTEGYIQHVDLAGDTGGDVGRVMALAGKLTQEKPLKRSTLQRYLSLIRDLPGLSVAVAMLKGDAPGAVRMVLTLTRKNQAFALNINNGGNPLLGRTQLEADLSVYDLFREGEETKLSFGTSTVVSRYQYYGLSHSEALDDDGTRAGLAYGFLRTDVGSIRLSGQAQTLQLTLSHPLIRSFDQNLILSASLDGLDSSNALIGTLISDEHVRALRASAAFSRSDAQSSLSLNASFSQGLDAAGARSATGAVGFQKLLLQGAYNRLLDPQWVVRLKGVGQVAGRRLPVSELYALGGPDQGRAFLSATALGDGAAAGSLEIGYDPNWLPDFIKGLELFGFADDGIVHYDRRGLAPALTTHLASAGAGIRVPIGQTLRLDLAAADAIGSNAPANPVGSWRLLFALTGTL